MEEVASEPESQTSNFGVTRVSTQSLIVLYKKVCLISLISAVCRDLSCLLGKGSKISPLEISGHFLCFLVLKFWQFHP